MKPLRNNNEILKGKRVEWYVGERGFCDSLTKAVVDVLGLKNLAVPTFG